MKDERGSGTVLVVLVASVLVMMITALAIVGTYLVRQHEARAGADLVALSAASAQGRGLDGCQAARSMAAQNRVSLVDCAVTGDHLEFVVSVQVEVSIDVAVPLLPDTLRATAYAGDVLDAPS